MKGDGEMLKMMKELLRPVPHTINTLRIHRPLASLNPQNKAWGMWNV